MIKTALVFALCFVSSNLLAQGVCPATTRSSNLICVIPQLYGPGGLTLPNPFHKAHFDSDFEASFTPLTAAIGTELTVLPIASPASGFTFAFDPSAGVVSRSAESFGPVLAERAETIGRHKFYLAFSYQRFGFDTIDGVNLNRLPATFTHVDLNPNGTPRGPNDPPSPGNPTYELDYITTSNRLDLSTDQFTAYGTFGLTDRIDISVAVPILHVSFNATSSAQIVRSPLDLPSPQFGYAHFFDPTCVATQLPPTAAELACQAASTTATFTNGGDATGIGDVIIRGKGTIYKGERLGFAAGLDIRTPTGDERNFLGSGAIGVKPFIVASYRARVSPHVNLGYQWNGESILGGDIATNTKGSLPQQFLYSGGVDIGVVKRFTIAADLIGQRLFDAKTVKTVPYVDIVGNTVPGVSQLSITTTSFNIDDLSVGAKFSPFGRLLITGNLLIKLNSGGLRSTVVPLVGVSYTF